MVFLVKSKIYLIDVTNRDGVQTAKLGALKKRRDADGVKRALAELDRAVAGNQNLMPGIIDAVKAYATVGEICDVMRVHWGEYKAPTYI